MFKHSGPSAVVGNWRNALGTVLLLKPDGTFDVDLTRDGKRDAWGKYSVEGDKITLIGTGGLNPKGCRGKGIYQFKRDDDSLRFTLVSDRCKIRTKNVLMDWRKK
ncbi:MAG: hypothetical protein ABJB69_08900 [Spartobacteria bacterium]